MAALSAFTLETAARITGVSPSLLARWDRSGFFSPSFGDPERFGVYRRIYSYQDLLALRVIARLRHQGIPMIQLRKVRDLYFDRASNQDWLDRKFYVLGRTLFFTEKDMLLAARPVGQSADPYVLDLGDVAEEVDNQILKLHERTPEEIGAIERHRHILGGTPVIAGTRTPVSAIQSLYMHGLTEEEILCEYPRLTMQDIRVALDYVVEGGSRAAS